MYQTRPENVLKLAKSSVNNIIFKTRLINFISTHDKSHIYPIYRSSQIYLKVLSIIEGVREISRRQTMCMINSCCISFDKKPQIGKKMAPFFSNPFFCVFFVIIKLP